MRVSGVDKRKKVEDVAGSMRLTMIRHYCMVLIFFIKEYKMNN